MDSGKFAAFLARIPPDSSSDEISGLSDIERGRPFRFKRKKIFVNPDAAKPKLRKSIVERYFKKPPVQLTSTPSNATAGNFLNRNFNGSLSPIKLTRGHLTKTTDHPNGTQKSTLTSSPPANRMVTTDSRQTDALRTRDASTQFYENDSLLNVEEGESRSTRKSSRLSSKENVSYCAPTALKACNVLHTSASPSLRNGRKKTADNTSKDVAKSVEKKAKVASKKTVRKKQAQKKRLPSSVSQREVGCSSSVARNLVKEPKKRNKNETLCYENGSPKFGDCVDGGSKHELPFPSDRFMEDLIRIGMNSSGSSSVMTEKSSYNFIDPLLWKEKVGHLNSVIKCITDTKNNSRVASNGGGNVLHEVMPVDSHELLDDLPQPRQVVGIRPAATGEITVKSALSRVAVVNVMREAFSELNYVDSNVEPVQKGKNPMGRLRKDKNTKAVAENVHAQQGDVADSGYVFRKNDPANKKKPRRRRKATVDEVEDSLVIETEIVESADAENCTGLRRSNRIRKPVKQPCFGLFYQNNNKKFITRCAGPKKKDDAIKSKLKETVVKTAGKNTKAKGKNKKVKENDADVRRKSDVSESTNERLLNSEPVDDVSAARADINWSNKQQSNKMKNKTKDKSVTLVQQVDVVPPVRQKESDESGIVAGHNSNNSDDNFASIPETFSSHCDHNCNGNRRNNVYASVVINNQLRKIKWVNLGPRDFDEFNSDEDVRLMQTVFVSSFVMSGYILIRCGKQKSSQMSKKYCVMYNVIEGTASVVLQESFQVCGPGSNFVVPLGVLYSITNISENKRLVLYFVRFQPTYDSSK